MPRSIWNGTICFSLVNVPVKLYTATESKTVSFHEVHLDDGGRIEHRRFCAKEEKEIPFEQVVKGYEVKAGEYVVLSKEEVKAAAGTRGRIVAVEHFVLADAIDPVHFARTYYLGPGDDGEDPYKVFHAALKRTGRAAIARFTFRSREYLAAIRPLDGVLALHTLRFADEVVDGGDLDLDAPSKAPSKREVEMAGQLVGSLHEDFDAGRYEDEYRAEVLALIERKAKGEELAVAPEEAEHAGDLAAALAASLEASSGRGAAKKRKPAARKRTAGGQARKKKAKA